MENKEYGWCDHLHVAPFYRPGGSTALRIMTGGAFVMWWINEKTCVLYCDRCYQIESRPFKIVGSDSLPTPQPPA